VQNVRPAGHVRAAHDPALQAGIAFPDAAHDVVQPPQWLPDETRLAHVPLQFVSGGVHAATQAPAAQTWFAAHALPHDPQCAGVVMSTSHPFPWSMSQSAHPVWQLAMTHALAKQEASACAREQGVHDPQPYAGSLDDTHAPEQSVVPAGHAGGAGHMEPLLVDDAELADVAELLDEAVLVELLALEVLDVEALFEEEALLEELATPPPPPLALLVDVSLDVLDALLDEEANAPPAPAPLEDVAPPPVPPLLPELHAATVATRVAMTRKTLAGDRFMESTRGGPVRLMGTSFIALVAPRRCQARPSHPALPVGWSARPLELRRRDLQHRHKVPRSALAAPTRAKDLDPTRER
jgi:hypothetical protein